MTTAGIRPQSFGMVFAESPTLQKQFSRFIKNENRKSAVKQAFSMSLHFFASSNFLVIAIYKHDVIEIELHYLQ